MTGTGQPGSKKALLDKLLYMPPGDGGKWPRAMLGQTCGQVPCDAGGGVQFPKHGSLGHPQAGPSHQTSRDKAVGVP